MQFLVCWKLFCKIGTLMVLFNEAPGMLTPGTS